MLVGPQMHAIKPLMMSLYLQKGPHSLAQGPP